MGGYSVSSHSTARTHMLDVRCSLMSGRMGNICTKNGVKLPNRDLKDPRPKAWALKTGLSL